MRYLLVDDHPLIRMGTKQLIQKVDDQAVINESGTLTAAKKSWNEYQCDIAILDIDLPDGKGFELGKLIKEQHQETTVIYLSLHQSTSYIQYAFSTGADAFLSKDTVLDELELCLSACNKGEIYLSKYQQDVLAHLSKNSVLDALQTLTKREIEVLKYVAQQFLSKEIADKMYVSVKSVDNYRARICKKLDLEYRNSALLLWSVENSNLIDTLYELI